MVFKMKKGFTMVEVLIVLAILAVFIIIALFGYRIQLAKGRDARRKSDLNKIQNILEDYMNDNGFYPDSFSCGNTAGKPLDGYAQEIPCDPLNNANFNYFYSYDSTTSRKSWYKIFSKLENTGDPVIIEVGCEYGCGPAGNYNYLVSSPNVSAASQQPGESWWPGGGPPPVPTATPTTPGPMSTPTPTGAPTSTPTPPSAPTATPTSSGPAPTATPTPEPPGGSFWGCFSGTCLPISGQEQCPAINYMLPDCGGQCFNPANECH